MLFVSYVPLLTTPAGIIKPLEQKENLMEMLSEAAKEYAIQAIAWVKLDDQRAYPILVLPFAQEIREHMVEWSGDKTDRYFTLVWNTYGTTGYVIVVLPNYDKSARRWHAMTRREDRLTILGHLFTYAVIQSEGFSSKFLEGSETIRVGFTSKMPTPEGELEDYSEVTMRARNFHALDPGERATLAPHFNFQQH